jgi:membrane protease YdiL (CAAX protease family)
MSETLYYCALVFWITVLLFVLRVPKPYELNIMGPFRNRLAWRYSLIIGSACTIFLFGMHLYTVGIAMVGVSPNEVTPPSPSPSLLFTAILLAPFLEEMLFRGVLFRWLKRTRLGPILSLLLSTIIFSIFHVHSIAACLFAVVQCLIVFRTDSAWPGIVTHSLYNILVNALNLYWKLLPSIILTSFRISGGALILLSSPALVVLGRDCYCRYFLKPQKFVHD